MTPLDDPHLHRALRSLPPPTAPATLAPRVMAAVRHRRAGIAPIAPTRSPLVLAAAAAGFAVAIVTQIWWLESPALDPHTWWTMLPIPRSVATVGTLFEACRLVARTVYASAAPWFSLAAVVAALACVPSLLLLDRLTETRA